MSSHRFFQHRTQGHAGEPPPTDVQECTAASTHAAVPAGSQGDVRSAGREGGGAQEGMGEGRGGGEEAAGEGGTGDGGGGRDDRGAGKGAGHPRKRRGTGSCRAAARIFGGGCRGWRGQSGTASSKRNGRREVRVGESPPPAAVQAAGYPAGGEEGCAGAGLEEDQGQSSEAGRERQGCGGAGAQGERGGGGGGLRRAPGHPGPGGGDPRTDK